MNMDQNLHYILKHGRVLTILLQNIADLTEIQMTTALHDQIIADLNQLASMNHKQLRYLTMLVLKTKSYANFKILIANYVSHYVISRLLDHSSSNQDDKYGNSNVNTRNMHEQYDRCQQYGYVTSRVQLNSWINDLQRLFQSVPCTESTTSIQRRQYCQYMPTLCKSYIKLILQSDQPITKALSKLLLYVQYKIVKNRVQLAVWLVQAIVMEQQLHQYCSSSSSMINNSNNGNSNQQTDRDCKKKMEFVDHNILGKFMLTLLIDICSIVNKLSVVQSVIDHIIGNSIKIDPLLLNQLTIIDYILTNINIKQIISNKIYNHDNNNNKNNNNEASDNNKLIDRFNNIIELCTKYMVQIQWPLSSVKLRNDNINTNIEDAQLDKLCNLVIRQCYLLLPYLNNVDYYSQHNTNNNDNNNALLHSITALSSKLFNTYLQPNPKYIRTMSMNTTTNRNIINLLICVINMGAQSNILSNGSKNTQLYNINNKNSNNIGNNNKYDTNQQYINKILIQPTIDHFTTVLCHMIWSQSSLNSISISREQCSEFVNAVQNINIDQYHNNSNNNNSNEGNDVLDCMGEYEQPLWVGYVRLITAFSHHFSQLPRMLANRCLSIYAKYGQQYNNNSQLVNCLTIGCLFNSILCTQSDYLVKNRQLLIHKHKHQYELHNKNNINNNILWVLWLLNMYMGIDDAVIQDSQCHIVQMFVERIITAEVSCMLEIVLWHYVIIKYYKLYKLQYQQQKHNIQAILSINIHKIHNNQHNIYNNSEYTDIILQLQLFILKTYSKQIQLKKVLQWLHIYDYKQHIHKYKQIVLINRKQCMQMYKVIASIIMYHIDNTIINIDNCRQTDTINIHMDILLQLHKHNILQQILPIIIYKNNNNNHNNKNINIYNIDIDDTYTYTILINNICQFIIKDPQFQSSTCQFFVLEWQLCQKLRDFCDTFGDQYGYKCQYHIIKLYTHVIVQLTTHMHNQIQQYKHNNNNNNNINMNNMNKQYSNYIQLMLILLVKYNLQYKLQSKTIIQIWDYLVYILQYKIYQNIQNTVKAIIILHTIIQQIGDKLDYKRVSNILDMVLKQCNRKTVRLHQDIAYFYRGKLYIILILLLQYCPQHTAQYLQHIKCTQITDITTNYRNMIYQILCRSKATYRDQYDYQRIIRAICAIFRQIGINNHQNNNDIDIDGMYIIDMKIEEDIVKFHAQYLHLYLKVMIQCMVAWLHKISENINIKSTNNIKSKNKNKHNKGSEYSINNLNKQPQYAFQMYSQMVNQIIQKVKANSSSIYINNKTHNNNNSYSRQKQQKVQQQFCILYQTLQKQKHKWLQQIIHTKKYISIQDITKIHALIQQNKQNNNKNSNSNSNSNSGKMVNRQYHKIVKHYSYFL